MKEKPKNRDDETEIEDDEDSVDMDAREAIESLEGYQEYLRENKGDNLTFGDY